MNGLGCMLPLLLKYLVSSRRHYRGRIHPMLLAWFWGKKLFQCMALVVLAASCAPFAGARQSPNAHAAIARTVILPQRMIAGASATLAVLDSAGRLVPNANVELSNGQKVTTDVTGRALFMAPGGAGKLTAKIRGQEIAASSALVAPADSAPQSPVERTSAGLQVVSFPHVLTIHDRFSLEGQGFRGPAESNHVFLAGQPCLVVASSPVSLVVLAGPHIPIGETILRVTVGGDSEQIPVSTVLLEFSGPTEAPNAGEQGKLILSVHGATDRLSVDVYNASPGIIQFPHGNVQRLTTSGGEENIALVELKFLTSGNYTVTARLTPTDSGSPPKRTSLRIDDATRAPSPAGRP